MANESINAAYNAGMIIVKKDYDDDGCLYGTNSGSGFFTY